MKRHFKGFVAKVEVLKSERATEDKNGLMPVILIGIAGEIPSRTVISGIYFSICFFLSILSINQYNI